MSISEHSNGLDSTIEFKCNNKKQYKRLSNYHFPHRIPQQTKIHSSEPPYVALIWYSNNFQWVFGMQLIGVGEGGINKPLRGIESTLAGIWEKNHHKNWSICGHGQTDGEKIGDWRGSSKGNKRHTRTQQSIIWWMMCSNRRGKNNTSFSWTCILVSMIWNTS